MADRLDSIDAAVVEATSDTSIDRLERKLERSPAVEYVEPDHRVQLQVTPNDPLFGYLWGIQKIDAPAAWDLLSGSNETVVAVVDTGVESTHGDLTTRMWRNSGESANGADDDGNGVIDDVCGADFANGDGDPADDNGHGTHVSGTIAGEQGNGLGVAGVDPRARIMGLKFLGADGSGYTSDAIDAIDYARSHGARVINASWGSYGYSTALRDAIAAAGNAGVLFVAAAGNSAVNADQTPMYPAAYDLDNIISVAATTSTDGRASFSNYGATSVDLGAPGVSILSTVPAETYAYLNGTSMAAPHVAGAASALVSRDPDAGYGSVRDALLTSVDSVAGLAEVVATGGRLNLQNAVQGFGSGSSSAPAIGPSVACATVQPPQGAAGDPTPSAQPPSGDPDLEPDDPEPPVARVSANPTQQLSKRGGVKLKVTCIGESGQRCDIRARGAVLIPRNRKRATERSGRGNAHLDMAAASRRFRRVPLRPSRAQEGEGETTTLRLRFSKRAYRKVKKALRQHGRLRAAISVKITTAGGQATARSKVNITSR